MIQIRNCLFETNSSSCHVFIYNPDESVSVPRTVTLVPNNEDSMLNILFNDTYCWYADSLKLFTDSMETFLSSLIAIGIKKVRCSDERIVELFENLINEGRSYNTYGDGLSIVLFSDNTKLTTISDHYDIHEIVEEEYGKEYKFITRRLS
jgi:hypothetical protein